MTAAVWSLPSRWNCFGEMFTSVNASEFSFRTIHALGLEPHNYLLKCCICVSSAKSLPQSDSDIRR